MYNRTIATEAFSRAGKHYFLDFKQAENNSHYIQITRSDEQEDRTFKRTHVIVFEEDFEFLIQAFSSLFRSAAYAQSPEVRVEDLPRRRENSERKGIKNWEPADRPREKMIDKGASAMENAELLAMLIGSGTPTSSAVDLARQMLASAGHDLKKFSEMGLEKLCRFHGMGIAKSCGILAAMELARRIARQPELVRRARIAPGIYVAVPLL